MIYMTRKRGSDVRYVALYVDNIQDKLYPVNNYDEGNEGNREIMIRERNQLFLRLKSLLQECNTIIQDPQWNHRSRETNQSMHSHLKT